MRKGERERGQKNTGNEEMEAIGGREDGRKDGGAQGKQKKNTYDVW